MSTAAAFPVAEAKALPAGEHAALVARMKAIVGSDNVLTATADLAAYECDGFTIAEPPANVVALASAA
jgi:glycolate oxidase